METPYPNSTNKRSQPRVSQACQMCKIKKAKCSQSIPCKNCQVHKWTCTYDKQRQWRESTRGYVRGSAEQTSSVMDSLHQGVNLREASVLCQSSGSSSNEIANSSPRDHGQHLGQQAAYDATQHNEGHSDANRSQNCIGGRQEVKPLDDVNEHTSGREYYGRSSKFALLGQLLIHARSGVFTTSANNAPANRELHSVVKDGNLVSMVDKSPVSQGVIQPPTKIRPRNKSSFTSDRLSIVNLLYDDEFSALETNADVPFSTAEGNQSEPNASIQHNSMSHKAVNSTRPEIGPPPTRNRNYTEHNARRQGYKRRASPGVQGGDYFGTSIFELSMEKEYLRVFFTNLHYIHPFLSNDHFTARCEQTIWARWPLTRIPRQDKHFLALYNVVLAVGSLIGSLDTFSAFKKQWEADKRSVYSDASSATSTIQLSKIFFSRSKRLLGDCFEVCSLESAQTLVLMSLYCQNALKPHACYMYSGMAVRTALAIGLPDSSMPQSAEWRDAARKTWWAIYSQEIDMCCSSGRISSLMNPARYDIPFPEIKGVEDADSDKIEAKCVAIIPEMVKFAAILLRASKEIYHEAKHLSIEERALIASDLDACLTQWKVNLPPWLRSDSNLLKEPEWVSKQRIVLELRYQNAKIMLHRPFVAASAVNSSSDFMGNVEACLNAARSTIHLLYESYLHRCYFRTWRYNTTYTIYAATIILYLILLDYNVASTEDLLADVQKSLDILEVMEEAQVARRCFDLIRELMEVAQNHIKQRPNGNRSVATQPQVFRPLGQSVGDRLNHIADSDLEVQSASALPQSSLDGFNEFFETNATSWARNPSTSGMWASMMDPTALEVFAMGDDYVDGTSFDGSWSAVDFYSSPPDQFVNSLSDPVYNGPR